MGKSQPCVEDTGRDQRRVGLQRDPSGSLPQLLIYARPTLPVYSEQSGLQRLMSDIITRRLHLRLVQEMGEGIAPGSSLAGTMFAHPGFRARVVRAERRAFAELWVLTSSIFSLSYSIPIKSINLGRRTSKMPGRAWLLKPSLYGRHWSDLRAVDCVNQTCGSGNSNLAGLGVYNQQNPREGESHRLAVSLTWQDT